MDLEKILSSKEWYYDQLHKQNGKTMTNFEIANGYAKYMLEKQAEFIEKRCDFDVPIKKTSNEFIKNIEL